jgi:hypothetical protein
MLINIELIHDNCRRPESGKKYCKKHRFDFSRF